MRLCIPSIVSEVWGSVSWVMAQSSNDILDHGLKSLHITDLDPMFKDSFDSQHISYKIFIKFLTNLTLSLTKVERKKKIML